jgi:hypothetical protein
MLFSDIRNIPFPLSTNTNILLPVAGVTDCKRRMCFFPEESLQMGPNGVAIGDDVYLHWSQP